jgi:hypothetical protein
MGVVKLPERVAASFSFYLVRRSRVELGAWGWMGGSENGPLQSLSQEPSIHPHAGERGGAKVKSLVASASEVIAVKLLALLTVQPAIRVRFLAAHIMLYSKHSPRQASAPNLPSSL